MEKKSYEVTSPIRHDGKKYGIGSTIELNEKEATDLRAAGAIGGEVIEKEPTAPTIPTDPAERLAAIVAAIGKLNPDDASLWLKDKRPDVAAITAITGWPVSAAERNDAWASMQPAV